MGKPSKKTNTQEIDPDLKDATEANLGLARMLAGLGYQPYQGINVADFTDAQKVSMESTNLAAGAFGMPTADFSGPTGARDNPFGISGFSTHEMMKESIPNYEDLVSFLDSFAKKASKGSSRSKKARTSSKRASNSGGATWSER